jgi:hypothetical protein
MDPLSPLTDADLTALACALRSGRLLAPFTSVSVQRYCPSTQAGEIAAHLEQLHQEGMKPQHLALLAETNVQTRSQAPRQSDLVDLVWTGLEAAELLAQQLAPGWALQNSQLELDQPQRLQPDQDGQEQGSGDQPNPRRR